MEHEDVQPSAKEIIEAKNIIEQQNDNVFATREGKTRWIEP